MNKVTNPSTEELPLAATETEANNVIGTLIASIVLALSAGLGN